MRRIIRRREVVADAVGYPGEAAPEGAVRVLALADWLAATAANVQTPAGVLLGPTDEVALAAFEDISVASQGGSTRLVAPRQRAVDGTPGSAPQK